MARVVVSRSAHCPHPAETTFTCDYAVVGGRVLAVYDAQPHGPGSRVAGHEVEVALPPLPEGIHDDVPLPSVRSPEEHAAVWAQRLHWDARYAIAGRAPLDDPLPGFAEWAQHLDERPVLVLGDGEGRHARALLNAPTRVGGPGRAGAAVTMVELSPVGAQVCGERAPGLDVVVGDLYRWLPGAPGPAHVASPSCRSPHRASSTCSANGSPTRSPRDAACSSSRPASPCPPMSRDASPRCSDRRSTCGAAPTTSSAFGSASPDPCRSHPRPTCAGRNP